MRNQHTACNKYIDQMKDILQKFYILTPYGLAIWEARRADHAVFSGTRRRRRVESQLNLSSPGPETSPESADPNRGNNTYVSTMAKSDQYNRDGP